SRRRHTSEASDWSSDVCSSDLNVEDRHRQKALATVAVMRDSRVVDGEETQRLAVIYPHRQRIVLKQQAKRCLSAFEIRDIDPDRSEERRVGKEGRGERPPTQST